MDFFAPEYFFFFWSVPFVIGLFVLSKRIWKKRLAKIGNLSTIQTKLMASYRPAEKQIRLFAFILALVFTVLALARPQWGEEKKKVERKGVDVVFLLDTSLSMLAEDIKPNRFEKSKIEIKSILQRLQGDRIGMVAFAGSSFLQSPLTLDYSAFRLFLDAIKVGYIPDPGTSLDRALKLAIRSFPDKDSKHRAVILLTDGEDHEGGLESALEEAKKVSLRVYTIGVGSAAGEPIPLRDENGRKSGFKKDRNGQVVVTKLNQPILEKIASETGAIYLPSTPAEQEVEILMKHMESLGKRQYKEKLITQREDHYQLFLILALLILMMEMIIKRTKKISVKNLAMALFFLMGLTGYAQKLQAADPMQLYEEKKYQSAMDVYQKAKIKNPDDPAVRYNSGTTLYQVDQFQEASKDLEKTLETAKEKQLKAKAYYNYGNTQYRLGNFEKSIEAYQKALELDPTDKDAKYNLEFLQKKKGAFDKKDSERQKDKQNQKQNQQQQKQNQQQQQNQKNEQQNQDQSQQQQQNQDQQQQQQNQQQQNQDQQQNQSQQQQNPQQDQQEQDQQQQDQEQSQDQKDQQPSDQNADQGEKPEEKEGEEEQKDQAQPKPEEPKEENQSQPEKPGGEQPQPVSPDQNQQDQPQPQPGQQQGKGQKPLQGQMTLENAMQILDALKEGEKDLQDLRRPGKKEGEPVIPEKDW